MAAINGSTVADRIQVTAGTLLLNGNVNPSTAAETSITLNSGGTLGGTGVWKATLTQTGGILSPGGAAPLAIDTLTLSNDLIVTGGSLLVNMNPVTQTNDVLNVTRSANINGATILISPTTKDAPLQNASTRVLDMSGTRTGQYAAAGFFFETGSTDGGNLVATSGTGAFVSSTVSLNVENGTDVRDQNVSVVHHYHTVPGLSSFGTQFGASLNNRVAETLNNSNPVLADFLGFLDYSDGATVAATLNSYEAAYLQSSMASMVVSAREIHRIVEQQNAGDRLFPSDAHAWVNFNYNDLSNTGSSSRYTLGGGGVIDGIHIGALISQGYADVSNSSDISTLSYGVYLGTGAATEWQVNAYFGGSNGKTNINRNISVFSQADPEGQGMQGVLSGAYMMEQGSCLWGPTFGIEYSSATMDRNSITPSANLPAMSFDADKLESFRLLLGGRADFNFDSNIRPYVSAQWAHEFIGDSDGYRATFQGGSFNVNTPYSLATDAIIVRAGIVVGLGKSWFGDLGYMGEYSINGDGEDFSGVNLGLRASF